MAGGQDSPESQQILPAAFSTDMVSDGLKRAFLMVIKAPERIISGHFSCPKRISTGLFFASENACLIPTAMTANQREALLAEAIGAGYQIEHWMPALHA